MRFGSNIFPRDWLQSAQHQSVALDQTRAVLSVLIVGLFIALLTTSQITRADAEVLKFKSPQEEALFKELTAELRCLVCQNQNLADSDADLAKDLKDQVYKMVQEGSTHQQVLDYMVTRYGDFVLYRPAFKLKTLLLWLGPLVFLLLTLFLVVRWVRNRPNAGVQGDTTVMSDAERQSVRELLDKER